MVTGQPKPTPDFTMDELNADVEQVKADFAEAMGLTGVCTDPRAKTIQELADLFDMDYQAARVWARTAVEEGTLIEVRKRALGSDGRVLNAAPAFLPAKYMNEAKKTIDTEADS